MSRFTDDIECLVETCTRRVHTSQLCSPHYQKYRRHGNPEGGQGPRKTTGKANASWRGGKSEHPLHDIYNDMLGRCGRESHRKYPDYGGRGIRVHPSWAADFWQFVADVGERPEGRTEAGRAYWQLDRIDNEGNYEPGNVRWASPAEQARNKRGYGDFESRRDNKTGRFT